MKRALHFLGDLVIGAILGYALGMLAYIVVFAVYGNLMHDMKTGQVVGFFTGMAIVPLVAILKIVHGQHKLSRKTSTMAGHS